MLVQSCKSDIFNNIRLTWWHIKPLSLCTFPMRVAWLRYVTWIGHGKKTCPCISKFGQGNPWRKTICTKLPRSQHHQRHGCAIPLRALRCKTPIGRWSMKIVLKLRGPAGDRWPVSDPASGYVRTDPLKLANVGNGFRIGWLELKRCKRTPNTSCAWTAYTKD